MKWNHLLKEEYIENIFKLAGLGVLVSDLEGHCVFANDVWQNLSGQNIEKALGRGWLEIVLEEDASMFDTIFKEFIGDPSQGVTFGYRIRHPEKGIVFLKANFRIQVLENKPYFLGCVQDITNLRSAEKEIQASKSIIKCSEVDKDGMFNALVHDLRNPIVGILGLTELILKNSNLDKEVVNLLRLIKEASSQSFDMITSLVNARLDANVEQVRREKTDLTKLLKYSVGILKQKAREKNQKVLLHAPNPVYAFIDAEKIIRVFDNLITNAIKFSPEATEISVFVTKLDNKITISVKDRGIGIPFELRPKIFDMFSSSKRTGTRQEPSFGLGLSICKQIVEAHGGKIWFNSSLTNGTSFYVELGSSST